MARLTPDVLGFSLQSSLDTVQADLTHSASSFGGAVVQPELEAFSEVTLSISNCGQQTLALEVRLAICEDLGSGMRNLNAEEKFLWTGTLHYTVAHVSICTSP